MVKGSKREQDLTKSRDSLISSLNRNKVYVFKNHGSMNISELETRLSLIESIFSQLCSIQTSIEQDSADESEFDKRQRFEDLYCEIKSKILATISQNQRRTSNTRESTLLSQTFNASGVTASRSSNLPKLKLPAFSGKYTEWTNWINTFTSIVDSDSELDDLSKFVHLRSCLGPVPLGTIEFLELTGANYGKAMILLRKRFENKSVIFQSHVKELFDLERVSQPSSGSLRRLIDIVNSHLHSLESLGSVEELKNVMVFYLARLKLDDETLSKWHESAKMEELPSWSNLEKFLSNRCLSLESHEVNDGKEEKVSKPSQIKTSGRKMNSKALSVSTVSTKPLCPCCGDAHKFHQCRKFLNLSPRQRYFEAKKYAICILCLEYSHPVRDCKAENCKRCGKPHHIMLHREIEKTSSSNSAVEIKRDDSKESATLFTSIISISTMNFLATALIFVKDVNGKMHEVRCILDSGSQLNFITTRLAETLKLHCEESAVKISGIGNSNTDIMGKVSTVIKSKVADFCCNLELYVLPQITNYSPNTAIEVESWNLPKNLKLADPYFYRQGRIDMLLGVGLFFKLLAVGQIRLADNLPILQKSLLGWVVVGECRNEAMNTLTVSQDACDIQDQSLMKLVEQFWKYEDISSDVTNSLSPEEQLCEDYFVSTVKRAACGRFIVQLPFRNKSCSLGRSYNMALKRFLNLERRLDANPELKLEYTKFIEEYELLGHLETMRADFNIELVKYFLPHHPVVRLESTTTKLRVVYDASAKTDNGLSLNDNLLVGARLQPNLFDILIRFRCYKYAITADISKMFRQVLVQEDDCMYQCILWRANKTDAIKILRLRTVTYGTSSAPFLSVRCMVYLAEQYREKYKLGSRVIFENFYMDDMLAGANSIEELYDLRYEVLELLNCGQFQLHKWRSNCADINSTDEELAINTEDCSKTLGIKWDSRKDVFTFASIDSNNAKCSKRVVLSEVARLYDPLGLVNPVILLGKIFLQHLWLLKLNWDESLPQELATQWKRYREELSLLRDTEFARSFWSDNELMFMELHGFSDASVRAYGAVVYARIGDSKGNFRILLMSAKSRVAPLKSVSLPRLELQGALLLAELMDRVKKSMSQKISNVYYWTDSTLVLQWLTSHPSRWSTFIANRVSKVHSLSLVTEWNKIDGKQNPADIVSRGMYPSDLKKSDLWFEGPPFLLQTRDKWPKAKVETCEVDSEMEERRAAFTLNAVRRDYERVDLVSSCKFCPTFSKMQRVFGYIYRWRTIIKVKSDFNSTPYLTVKELNGGLNYIMFNIQNIHFFDEKQSLIVNKNAKSASVQKLNPFLDNSDLSLLRVGGRLSKSQLPYEVKHPILLPGDHAAVYSLVVHLHKLNLHPGALALSAFVRQRFWVINIRKIARKVVRQCIRCFKHKPKPLVQLMGDLPSYRVNGNARPFENSGMDFAGPINVHYKIRGKRPYKAYLAIFVCFLTKACHIEVVSDLSTDTFIASLKRFFARRGLCSNLFCDNATNFVGADRKINEMLFTESGKNDISNECADRGVQFHFIPPRSPHFGGLWESAVKVAKHLLVRHSNSTSLTYEELCTAVAQIEAIMNSRPLCPMSSDANDLEALTPGHFLIGRPLNSFPEPIDENELNISHSNRWKRIQAVQMMFWRRWSREYLSLMQERMKWHKQIKNLDIGALVLISEDNIPPSNWLLGRVIETHSGTDGMIRVVTLRTKSGTLKRSIHRLCPLPLD